MPVGEYGERKGRKSTGGTRPALLTPRPGGACGVSALDAAPVERILPSQVEAFGIIIGKRLRDRASSFGRDYLRAVVDKVVVNGDTATISGSNAKLMRAVGAKKALAGQVPSFIHDWRARRDSNSHSPGSWFVARR